MNNRRNFIKTATALGTGIAITSVAGELISCSPIKVVATGKKAFGLQLYTLRDDLPKDPKGILKQVASFGYTQIENFEHDKLGLFCGMKNTEYKSYLDSLGMTQISAHCDYKKDFEKKADEAAAIGMKYLLCPWLGPQTSLDAFKKFAEDFNRCGAICKQRGIKYGYHNHDYSFRQLEGQYPQDVLMQQTDKDLVDFEMDMYWVVKAGQNPVTWFEKYPSRFRLAHIKDSSGDETGPLGKGTIDYAALIAAAKKAGLTYLIVEQEHYAGTTPIDSVRDNASYMRKILG